MTVDTEIAEQARPRSHEPTLAAYAAVGAFLVAVSAAIALVCAGTPPGPIAGKDFDERIERPARTFNNLLQVPLLFYVACLAMMSTARLDAAQLRLAWLFVALRAAHAAVYLGWNHVPSRFATWIAGCLVLGAIWVRLVFP